MYLDNIWTEDEELEERKDLDKVRTEEVEIGGIIYTSYSAYLHKIWTEDEDIGRSQEDGNIWTEDEAREWNQDCENISTEDEEREGSRHCENIWTKEEESKLDTFFHYSEDNARELRKKFEEEQKIREDRIVKRIESFFRKWNRKKEIDAQIKSDGFGLGEQRKRKRKDEVVSSKSEAELKRRREEQVYVMDTRGGQRQATVESVTSASGNDESLSMEMINSGKQKKIEPDNLVDKTWNHMTEGVSDRQVSGECANDGLISNQVIEKSGALEVENSESTIIRVRRKDCRTLTDSGYLLIWTENEMHRSVYIRVYGFRYRRKRSQRGAWVWSSEQRWIVRDPLKGEWLPDQLGMSAFNSND